MENITTDEKRDITFNDVLRVANELANDYRYDRDPLPELEVVKGDPSLPDRDKSVIGMALCHWSMHSSLVKSGDGTPTCHSFMPFDAHASALGVESILRDCRFGGMFESSAPFVNDMVDAVFVLINSLSRGFNIKSLQRFGGDPHLRFICAIFVKLVCAYLSRKFASSKGFDAYCDAMQRDGNDDLPKSALHRMYAKFLTWIRKRFADAISVIRPAVKDGCVISEKASIPSWSLVELTQSHSNEAQRLCATKKRVPQKTSGSQSDGPEKKWWNTFLNRHNENCCDGTKPTRCKDCDKTCRKDAPPDDAIPESECNERISKPDPGPAERWWDVKKGGEPEVEKPESDVEEMVTTASINGREFKIVHRPGDRYYTVTGDIHEDDLATLAEFDIIPKGLTLKDGKLIPIN